VIGFFFSETKKTETIKTRNGTATEKKRKQIYQTQKKKTSTREQKFA